MYLLRGQSAAACAAQPPVTAAKVTQRSELYCSSYAYESMCVCVCVLVMPVAGRQHGARETIEYSQSLTHTHTHI